MPQQHFSPGLNEETHHVYAHPSVMLMHPSGIRGSAREFNESTAVAIARKSVYEKFIPCCCCCCSFIIHCRDFSPFVVPTWLIFFRSLSRIRLFLNHTPSQEGGPRPAMYHCSWWSPCMVGEAEATPTWLRRHWLGELNYSFVTSVNLLLLSFSAGKLNWPRRADFHIFFVYHACVISHQRI